MILQLNHLLEALVGSLLPGLLQAQQQQLFKAYAAAGLSPEKARLAAMGGAKFGDLAPAPAADPERVRTAQCWRNAAPEQRPAVDDTNPNTAQGNGATVVPRASLPQGGALPPQYDPNEWEVVPGQGGAGVANAPRNFRRR